MEREAIEVPLATSVGLSKSHRPFNCGSRTKQLIGSKLRFFFATLKKKKKCKNNTSEKQRLQKNHMLVIQERVSN